jgi:ribosomal protein L13
MSAIPDYKRMLLDAFDMERKATDLYDMVYNALTASQKQNIQKTLIGILFVGDAVQFEKYNEVYREAVETMLPADKKLIQCFHRTAMAFSRRKAKEVDDFDATKVANAVSQAEGEKKTRESKGAKEERLSKPAKAHDPEKLIQEALSLVKRDDVKALLQQALIQMKLAVPILGTQHFCVTDNLNSTFETFQDIDEESGVWW